MKTSILPRLLPAFLALWLAAAACTYGNTAPTEPPTQPPATAVPATQAAASPVPTAAATLPPRDFNPPPAAECQQIQGKAAGALKVAFTMNEAPFTLPNGQNGVGCVLQAKGTGVDFQDIPAVYSALKEVFPGWIDDPTQSADGPTATIWGWWQGSTLLLNSVEWQPSPDANCPADQPIGMCNLKPEQRLFTVTLTAGVAVNPPTLPTAPVAPAVPTPTVPAIPTNFAVDQIMRLDAGPLDLTINGSVTSGTYNRYKLPMAAGEGLDIHLSSPQQTAGFVLLGPDLKALPGTENQRALWYSANALATGEYAIIVGSIQGKADYTLVIKITESATSAYQPLPNQECAQIQQKAENALSVAFIPGQDSFSLPTGESGLACTLAASGTGADFESVSAVIAALQGAFGGWSEDNNLAAGGPTGMAIGLRRGSDVMTITVQWEPSDDANCPTDQPIASCDLLPEQRLYSIYIQVARK
ncbi:MAG: hypothetical protein AB1894_02845 [Chloroflexota bacterium]